MKLRSLEDLSKLLPESPTPSKEKAETPKPLHDGKGKTVRVLLDTKGRKGKSVTLVIGLQHDPATMEKIARVLKQHCGAGGTVKEGVIEIQGDNQNRVKEKLLEMNYRI